MRIAGVALLALLGSACGMSPEQAAAGQARLAAVKAEGEQLNDSLSEVEARLHVNRARVALWQELGTRHKSVSAVACEVADSHMLAMVNHVEKNDKKRRQAAKWKRRVAGAVPASSGTGGQR